MENTIAVKPTELVLDKKSLLDYRHPAVINRYMKEQDCSEEEATTVFQETKKLLALVVLFPEVSFSPSEAQDAMWHEFIMYTKDYAAFCDKFFGTFIHHEPCEGGLKVTNGCKAKELATKTFGDIKPEYWPNLTTTMRCCGMCLN